MESCGISSKFSRHHLTQNKSRATSKFYDVVVWTNLVTFTGNLQPELQNVDVDKIPEKKTHLTLLIHNIDLTIFEKFYQIATRYCIRFIKNCSSNKLSKQTGALKLNELNDSLQALVKFVQKQEFRAHSAFTCVSNSCLNGSQTKFLVH